MIGNFNRKIEFWKPTGAVNEANEPLPDAYAFYKSRWAQIRGETGMGAIRSSAAAGISAPLNRYSFRINYDTSITDDMQVRERDGTRYNILSIRHDKADREWTDVVAETGGSNG